MSNLISFQLIWVLILLLNLLELASASELKNAVKHQSGNWLPGSPKRRLRLNEVTGQKWSHYPALSGHQEWVVRCLHLSYKIKNPSVLWLSNPYGALRQEANLWGLANPRLLRVIRTLCGHDRRPHKAHTNSPTARANP